MQADKLKTGKEHVKARSGGSFTPTIFWKEDGETHYIAWITPAEEFITLDVHMVECRNSEHDWGWRTFVCRKNEAFEDESDGKCALCDVHGDRSTRQTYALAAELDAVEERIEGRRQITGLQVKMIEVERDGETKEYPRIGVINQGPGNFYSYFTSYDTQRAPITTLPFEIVRDGKGTKTKYQVFPVPDLPVPDLTEFEANFPDLIQHIAEQGSEARYTEELVDVRVRKRNSGRGGSPSTTTTTPDPVAEEENETTFDALRKRLEEKNTT